MKRISRCNGISYSDYLKQNMVYYQMSNHYRRLYNAKSVVDSSPPYSMRPRECSAGRNNVQPAPSDLPCYSRNVHDSTQSPNTLRLCQKGPGWREEVAISSATASIPSSRTQTNNGKVKIHSWSKTKRATKTTPAKNAKTVPDIMEQHKKNFIKPDKAFKPRILKNAAQSRVRDLKVYHPPRRRQQSKVANSIASQMEYDEQRQQIEDCHSSTSSAEGAWPQIALYTDNVVPVSPPKVRSKSCRSPAETWPQIAFYAENIVPASVLEPKVCSQSCRPPAETWPQMALYTDNIVPVSVPEPKACSKVSSRDSAYNGGLSSGGDSRGPTPEQSPLQARTSVAAPQRNETRHKQQVEDALYIKFIHDVTQDILISGIYSNKGLKQLFRRHIRSNIGILNIIRMKEEIAKLEIQLDIVDDGDNEMGGGYYNSNVDSFYHNEEQSQGNLACCTSVRAAGSIQTRVSNSVDSDPKISLTQGHSSGSLGLGSMSYFELQQMCHKDRTYFGLQQLCQEELGKIKVIENNLTMAENEVIHTLEEMGFDTFTAKEICNSLSDKDLQPTFKLESVINVEDLEIIDKQLLRHDQWTVKENVEREFPKVQQQQTWLREDVPVAEEVFIEKDLAVLDKDVFAVDKQPSSYALDIIRVSLKNIGDKSEEWQCTSQSNIPKMTASQTNLFHSVEKDKLNGNEFNNLLQTGSDLEKKTSAELKLKDESILLSSQHTALAIPEVETNSIPSSGKESEQKISISPHEEVNLGETSVKDSVSMNESKLCNEISKVDSTLTNSKSKKEATTLRVENINESVVYSEDDDDMSAARSTASSVSVAESTQQSEAESSSKKYDGSICDCECVSEIEELETSVKDTASEIDEEIDCSDCNSGSSSVSFLAHHLKKFSLDTSSPKNKVP